MFLFRKIASVFLFLLTATLTAGGNGAFNIVPGSVIQVEDLAFRLYHWERGWKNGTEQKRNSAATIHKMIGFFIVNASFEL